MSPKTSVFRITLVGLVSLAIAMGIGRFAFTPLLPLMRDEGLASIAEGGLLASVHFLGYWLGAVFAVRLRYAPKATLRLSLITIGFCTLGMGVTDSFGIWLMLRWLSGVCSAFALVLVGNYYIKHLADVGRARMQGWVFSGVGAGIAVAGLGVLAIMASHIGSAPSWQIFGVVTIVAVFAVCARMGPEIPATRLDTQARKSPPSPLIWSVVIAYGAAGIGYIIPATYLPVMAREIVQSPLVFGLSWPIFGAAAFISTLLAARLQGRFSNRRIWAASQLVMAVGLVLPVIYPHIVTIIVAGVCVGGTFMIITMMGIREAHRIAPPHDVMRHIAVMTASFATGQMIGPVFASSLYGLTGSFSASLLSTSVVLVITALALMIGASRKKAVLGT
ncbi:MAG: YbfB/YjiJ family MFS transporter [Alphaproteobacteria bacterium]